MYTEVSDLFIFLVTCDNIRSLCPNVCISLGMGCVSTKVVDVDREDFHERKDLKKTRRLVCLTPKDYLHLERTGIMNS